jgi:hypothetical protein
MKSFSIPALLAAALFSAVVSLPFMPFAASRTAVFHLEATVTSTARGSAQLFYNVGQGIREEDSAHALVETGGAQTLRFDLPAGHYTQFRFDPLDRPATMTIAAVTLRDAAGTLVHRFAATDFTGEHDVSLLAPQPDGSLKLELPPNSTDPITHLTLSAPLDLRPELGNLGPALLRLTLPIFVVVVALLGAAQFVSAAIRNRLRAWVAVIAAKPGRAVALVAAFSVVVSSYPVVFLGKSFVSPNLGPVVLLYEAFPTLPGYRDSRTEEVKGADVGALMWQHVPLTALQNRALFRDHELPLWNRYNSAGIQLLGQGQSMFGDPLHFFVILANSAAWAWDVKFLFAKWLLAAGVGLCVLRGTRHLPSAAILAAIMPFIGYFVFRVNHPAIFSTCYAPWMLLCWMGIAGAPDWRGAARWVGGLILANWCEMNSGTVKEAYMSLLTLNFAGAVALLVAALPPRERVRRFALAAAGGVIFALLAAPIWLTFLDALAQSYTEYDAARAYQVQPSLALAFFDEVLFRPFWEHDNVYNGSVNFIVLLGVLAFLVNLRRICTERLALGLALATLLPLAIIFGVIPPDWIVQVPFLGNVAHLDNSFFCPVITLLGVLAGYGFRAAAQRLGTEAGRGDMALGLLLLGGLAGQYLAFGHTVQRSTYSYWHWGEQINRSPFVVWSLAALLAAAIGCTLVVRAMLVRRAVGAASLLTLATCGAVMLWRFGLHGPTGFSDYVIAPPSRVNFQAASPAIAAAREDRHGEPGRFVGLNGNAFHGWMNIYDFEGIAGPDALSNPHVRELQQAIGFERIWAWRIYSQYSTLATLKRAYDFFNVRHFFDYASDQGRLGAVLTPVKMGDLDVYRSDTAWPRAFFTNRVAVYAEPAALATLINHGDGRPFAAMQAGDEPVPAEVPADLASRTVTPASNYQLTTNTTSFDIDATGPGLAVLQETWLRKDFRARVDGKPTPYLRVNHAFKGVYITTPGSHHIEFEYWPRRMTESLAMSAVGALLLFGAGWIVLKVPRKC